MRSGVILGQIFSILIAFKLDHSYFASALGQREKTFISVCNENALLSAPVTSTTKGEKNEKRWKLPENWMSFNETEIFSLTVFEPKCWGTAERHLNLTINKTEDDNNGGQTQHFFRNGYFQYSRHVYAPDEYCIESFTYNADIHFSHASTFSSLHSIRMKFCKPDCSPGKRRPCIKKCCPLYQIYSGKPGSPFCERLSAGSLQFAPDFYENFYTKVEQPKVVESEIGVEPPGAPPFSTKNPLPHYKIQHPKTFKENCIGGKVLAHPTSVISAQFLSSRYRLNITDMPLFRLRRDGTVIYKSVENKCGYFFYKTDHFCVDGMKGALIDDLTSPFNNTEEEYISYQCSAPEKSAILDKYISSTFATLLLITSVFPLITSVVYILLWKRQNVHGWAIAATSGSLYFMYLFHAMAHIIGITLPAAALNTFYCQLIGILTHFFMMSTFTWCTVMSCDLWLTFRSVVPMNQRLQAVPRFIKYSIFGWGVPAVIVMFGIIMDFVISTSTDCRFYEVPAYGQESCWLVENALGVYLYYPGLLLICINIGLFTATCIKLCMYGKGPAARSRGNDAFGECFSRFSKLFCVMGISWIFEILSWCVDGLGYVWYWNIIDVFNILRAVVIFVIYVCKKDIIHQLEDAYPSMKNIFRPFSRFLFRKCSDQLSVESTAFSAAATMPMPSSPGIPMKTTNCNKRSSSPNNN